MIYLTTNMSLLQLSIPAALRGQVTGIVSLQSGLMPVGAFITGLGSDLPGPPTTAMILGRIVGTIVVVVFLTSPTNRDYRPSQALGNTASGEGKQRG